MKRFFLAKALTVAAVLIAAAAPDSFAQGRPSMELLQTKTAHTGSAIEVTGQVKNISPRPVEGVTVNCDFQDGSGKVVKTEKGTLATDPLAPEKTSDFKCSTPASAAVKGFRVRFAQLFGGPLTMKDSRK